MPLLPVQLPFIPGAGDVPVVDESSVRAELPGFARGPAADAPVRETIVAGQTAMFLAYQPIAGDAAAQSDPTRATGTYLDGLVEDRGFARQAGELDEALRTRVFGVAEAVTPDAIRAAADAVLAPYTTKRSRCFESVLDRMFVNDGTPAWHSFIGSPPEYPDRYYADRPWGRPSGSWCFGDQYGRYFVLIVPVLEAITGGHAYLLDGTVDETLKKHGAYIHDGTNTGGSEADGTCATFISIGLGTAGEIYQAIVNSIERIRGAGVRWQLLADPSI